jgi:flagellar protein FlbD
MIRLSRLNHQEIAINCDLIEYVEAKPDTTVRLVTGDSILVLESVEEVIRRITEFRRNLMSSAGLAAMFTSGWRPTASLLRRREDGTVIRSVSGDADDEPGGGER